MKSLISAVAVPQGASAPEFFTFVFLLFDNQLLVTPAKAGAVAFGWAPQTVYNRLSAGTFPLPLVTPVAAGERMVRVTDVISFLFGLQFAPHVASPAQKRKRGRPSKRQQLKKSEVKR